MSTINRQFRQRGFIDKIGMPTVTRFISNGLDEYDTALIEWIKLLPLNKKNILHGECAYPVCSPQDRNILPAGYRIRASVNVEVSPPYTFAHWGRIPSSHCKQGWYSGARNYRWETLEEVAIHTLAHECFHFLSHTKQLRMKNTEANANWWADNWLDAYRDLYYGT